jgi:glutaredoxin
VPQEVTLYTRADCHLCDDAAAMLDQLATALDFTVTKVDIDGDPALTQLFNDVVPVVAVGEQVVAEAPAEIDVLRGALRDALGRSG